MRQETITVYNYSELPDASKDRAKAYYLKHWSYDDFNHHVEDMYYELAHAPKDFLQGGIQWCDSILETIEVKVNTFDLYRRNCTITLDLDWESLRDYSIEQLKLSTFEKDILQWCMDNDWISLEGDYTVDTHIDAKHPRLNKLVNRFIDYYEDTYKELKQDIEHEILKHLENIDEWISSDEYIADTFEANEIEFTEDGSIYR